MARDPIHDAAIEYAEQHGFAVLVTQPDSKEPYPKTHGHNDASTDVVVIDAMFERYPGSNIAISCGEPSGNVVVIDVDNKNGGDGSGTIREWEAQHGELPETVTCCTTTGGYHLYYRVDPERNIHPSINHDKDIDIRATGSYAMLPPSTIDGMQYVWEFAPGEIPIAEADDNVYAFIESVQKKSEVDKGKFTLPDVINSGERNDTLYRYACRLRALNADYEAILDAVNGANITRCKHPLPAPEVAKIVDSACTHDAGPSEEVAIRKTAANMLARNQRGKPLSTIDNFMVVLENDARLADRFWYNSHGYLPMVSLPLPWDDGEGVRRLKNVDVTQFTAFAEKQYGISGKTNAGDAIANVCDNHSHNPIVEWLESLRWDGVDRIPTMLPMFLKADQTEYTTEVMRLFMHAACARAVNPGCKFDTMMVLAGEQGIGKSYFLRLLSHDPEWFNDNFSSIHGDAAIEKLQGMWILEMAELLATDRPESVEAVKAFLSSSADTIRPKYGKVSEQRPRACVFAGTTNNLMFLHDQTGDRRFLPIECKAERNHPSEALFDDGAADYIEKCWAQAYDEWKNSDDALVLPKELLCEAETIQMRYKMDDPRIGVIQDYLDMRDKGSTDEEGRVCVQEIIKNALGIDNYAIQPKSLTREVHEIMRNSITGWSIYAGNSSGKARTKHYGVQRCYVADVAAENANGNKYGNNESAGDAA